MKIIYMVINENADMRLKPITDRYRVFDTPKGAIDHARKCGWLRDPMGMGFNWTPGMENICQTGDIKLRVFALELSEVAAM